MFRRPPPHPRYQRSNCPRLGQERDSREIQGCVEDVSAPLDHCAPKVLVEEVLLRQSPADQLAAAAHWPLQVRATLLGIDPSSILIQVVSLFIVHRLLHA